ncbi:unnamed protein product [Caenorhabditis auriculariae]|uniref:Glutaminyl-tRNA synthetase class Ib non-specific RNA-binding domain-containing protein n=1 Tax=Caenorhabditis auriculariae TaxID=2777116 RepID=A0A8S1HJK5_9PELO|nr:unnamed protein product [Caenorhabditis auriculariae]
MAGVCSDPHDLAPKNGRETADRRQFPAIIIVVRLDWLDRICDGQPHKATGRSSFGFERRRIIAWRELLRRGAALEMRWQTLAENGRVIRGQLANRCLCEGRPVRLGCFLSRIPPGLNEGSSKTTSPVQKVKMSTDDLLWLGLSQQKAAETLKNANLVKTIGTVVSAAKEAGAPGDLPKTKGTLLYQLSTKIKPQCAAQLPLIVKYILSEGLKSEAQLSAAIEYVLSHTVKGIDVKDFEKAAGVGIVVSIDEIEDAVTLVINKHKDQIIADRYTFNVGKTFR